MSVELVDEEITIPVFTKVASRKKAQLNIFHLFCIALAAFWFGVVFASITLNTRVVRTTCRPPDCTDDNIVIGRGTRNKSKKYEVDENQFVTRKLNPVEENESIGSKKIILLYGDNIWTKYDKWHRYDWRKCPPKYSNCRITTDATRLSQSSAVVYNAAAMPSLEHVSKIKGEQSIKRVFLSGLTPLRTTFDPQDYNNFFDISITYKSDSDIRIPYWPNDGLLPSMFRPKPEENVKALDENDMLDLEDEIKNYFIRSGKQALMAVTVTNCGDDHFPNLFVKKLQEEGLIHTYALNNSESCLKRLKDTVVLPCQSIFSDDCVKHFETFKFVITPDDDLCKDYTTRDYWNAIFAWQAVPLLYGAGDYKKHLIPNSYIDTVGNEDYISPSFKKAYFPSLEPMKYYKTFHLWRHEDRVEKYHWQCELCRELHEGKTETPKLDMNNFWDKNKECGDKLRVHELMRLQLVRTGVIR